MKSETADANPFMDRFQRKPLKKKDDGHLWMALDKLNSTKAENKQAIKNQKVKEARAKYVKSLSCQKQEREFLNQMEIQ